MADLIATGTSGYSSGAIDTASVLIDNVSPISAKHPNGLAAAVTQVETILGSGTVLKGTLATLAARLAVLLEATGLLRSGATVPNPVIQGSVTGTYTLDGTPTIHRLPIAGTALTMNPYATTTVTSGAHGLGIIPAYVDWYLECLTTDAGYTAGDRVYTISDTGSTRGFAIFADGTSIGISTDGTVPAIQHKSTTTSTVITAAKWKLVVTPFKITV